MTDGLGPPRAAHAQAGRRASPCPLPVALLGADSFAVGHAEAPGALGRTPDLRQLTTTTIVCIGYEEARTWERSIPRRQG